MWVKVNIAEGRFKIKLNNKIKKPNEKFNCSELEDEQNSGGISLYSQRIERYGQR